MPKIKSIVSIKTVVFLFFIGLIGFAIYSPGLKIQYYGDDFQFVFDSPSLNIFYYFSHGSPHNVLIYRPLEALFLAMVQKYFGMNTLPLHLTQITIHILFSLLVFVFILRLNFSKVMAILGTIFMLVAQINVHAVLSNDTFSQICGSFLGCVCLWFLYNSFFDSSKIIYRYYLYSLLAFCLSLFSKESSVSFFLLLSIMILAKNLNSNEKRSSMWRSIIEVSPFAIVLAIYLIARSFIVLAQPSFGTKGYSFHVGLNIVKNLAILIFSAFVPVSSVKTFTYLKNGMFIHFSIIIIASFCLFFSVLYGLSRSERRSEVILLWIFVVLSLFPMAMLNHICELYVYNSIAFISILIGIGLGKLFELCKENPVKIAFFAMLICLLCICNVSAIRSKALQMDGNGERANALITQIEPYVSKLPKHGTLFLMNPAGMQLEYSVFLKNNFNVLRYGLNRIKHVSNRDDIYIGIIEQSDLEKINLKDNSLVLSLSNGEVKEYQDNDLIH